MGSSQRWSYAISVTGLTSHQQSVMSSSSVLINNFCMPYQGHWAAAMECKKTHVDVCPTSRALCFTCTLTSCFVPVCTAWCHCTGGCTFLVLNMANSVRIWSKPQMIPISSLNGMKALSQQNMLLANTIELYSICSVLRKMMLLKLELFPASFLFRFFYFCLFSESSLFFISLV